MILRYDGEDGAWKRCWFRSLLAVKRWATKNAYAWRQTPAGTVVISTDRGEIWRYKKQ